MKKILAMLLMLSMLAASVPVLADEMTLAYTGIYCPHRWIAGQTITEPSCTATGTATKVCALCPAISTELMVLPVIAHDYSVVFSTETPATCTTNGLGIYACSVCGEKESVSRVIPAFGHSYKLYNNAASCTEPGFVGTACSVCGVTIGDTFTSPALGHEYAILPPKDATCTEDGLTIGEYCTVCKEVFQRQEVIPACHEYTILMPKDPSCTESGLSIGEYCAVCKEVFQPQTILPALGHKAVVIPGIPADCANTGLTEGSKCSVCNAVLTAQQLIPAADHEFELSGNGKKYICANCGEEADSKPKDITINTKASIELDKGDTLELEVIYSPAGSYSPITWSSSNKKVVSIDADGVIEALKEGSATITAKSKNGRKDSIKVKVVDPYKVTKVELDQSGTIILGVGEELQLNAAIYPETADSVLEWDSNSSRCKVDDDGLVTAVRTGSATITVKTENGKTDTVKVRVVNADVPYSVELSESSTIELTVGEEFQLDAVVYPASADYELSWSTGSSRGEVDDNGLLTALRPGSFYVTVKTDNGKKDTVKVRITD